MRVEPELIALMVELANRTRHLGEAATGVSTRGAQALHRACRARAVCQDRDYVTPDDVRSLLPAVWSHRLSARGGSEHAEALLQDVLHSTRLPE